MITSLRKRHRLIWTLWVVLLPMGMIAAVMVVREYPSQELTMHKIPEAYPEVLKAVDHPLGKVNLRKDAGGAYQLELFLKEPISSPAPMLYLNMNGQEEISGNVLVGNILGTGLYRFSVSKEVEQAQGVFFHSKIAGRVVKSIPFTDKPN